MALVFYILGGTSPIYRLFAKCLPSPEPSPWSTPLYLTMPGADLLVWGLLLSCWGLFGS